MNTIYTHDKPSMVAAFASAINSDSDTLIQHKRESGVTELFVRGEAFALDNCVAIETVKRKQQSESGKYLKFKPVTDKEEGRLRKRVLRSRKRAVSKMRRAAIKVLCS